MEKLDGNKKIIANVWITRPIEDNVALFNSEIRAIKNLQFLNFNIIGKNKVFGLTTKMYEGTVIENNLLSGKITGNEYVAGITLRQDETHEIKRIDSDIIISASGPNVGGLVVEQENGIIELVHVGGDIVGTNNVGGIVANQKVFGVIRNSYVTGFIRGNQIVGGIAGYSEGMGNANYFNGDLDCADYCGVILGKFTPGIEFLNCYYPRRLSVNNQNTAMGTIINPRFTKDSFGGFIFSDKDGPWNFVSGELPTFKKGIFDFCRTIDKESVLWKRLLKV